MQNNGERVYLDYNSTAPLKPEAAAVMSEFLGRAMNPSSVHFEGRAARSLLEKARSQVATAIGAKPSEIIFMSSATEANNSIMGIRDSGFGVRVSATEHHSVLKAAGGDADIIPVDENGVVNITALEKVLSESKQPALLSVIMVNNETGVINPIAEIAEVAKKYGALLHTDASQAAGKVEIDFTKLGVDYMTLSGHKAGSVVGAAALVVREGAPYSPFMVGGGQEYRRRAGTENVSATATMGEVFTTLENELAKASVIKGWRDKFENKVSELDKGAIIHSKGAPRVAGVSALSMPGVSSETQIIAFDMEGISISAGSACTSGKIEPSHVLLAMGVTKNVAECSIRISAGWNTQKSDFDALYNVWEKIYLRTRTERQRAA